MKYIFILIMMFSGFSQAITLDDVQKNFAMQKVVRANFTQERQIKSIKVPLVSHGNMLLSQDKGLFWQQTDPFVTTLILRDNDMLQRMDGLPDQRITADSNPQMFQFTALLKALVKADKSVLEGSFKLHFVDLGAGQWQLDLFPTITPLDKLFNEIQLKGNTVLSSVVLIDKQGDSTKITFYDHQRVPIDLTQAEVSYFE